jgi:hypothetical protein
MADTGPLRRSVGGDDREAISVRPPRKRPAVPAIVHRGRLPPAGWGRVDAHAGRRPAGAEHAAGRRTDGRLIDCRRHDDRDGGAAAVCCTEPWVVPRHGAARRTHRRHAPSARHRRRRTHRATAACRRSGTGAPHRTVAGHNRHRGGRWDRLRTPVLGHAVHLPHVGQPGIHAAAPSTPDLPARQGSTETRRVTIVRIFRS